MIGHWNDIPNIKILLGSVQNVDIYNCYICDIKSVLMEVDNGNDN